MFSHFLALFSFYLFVFNINILIFYDTIITSRY
nr:MAG TPA: hypothetical protein [Inoviridae sp.]DAW75018.1 MAG TPA: hypothetical protein [Inoviridae sp.]